MKIDIKYAAWAFLFHIIMNSAWSIETRHQESISQILGASKADPNKIYYVSFGAPWCGYCKALEAMVKDTNSGPIGRSYWAETQDPDIASPAMQASYNQLSVIPSIGVPYTVAIKGGQPAGDIQGFISKKDLEDFTVTLEKTSALASATAATVQKIPSFPCKPNEGGGTASPINGICILGVSGAGEYNGTENFGRANLLSFKSLFSDARFAALFAPPFKDKYVGATLNNERTRIFATNPLLAFEREFDEKSDPQATLENLDRIQAPETRLLFTGHGGWDGISTVGQSGKTKIWLEPKKFKDDIDRARAAGKTIKGVFTQCYGGEFGLSLMPSSLDQDASKVCGEFAGIPEKPSTGCYPAEYQGARNDYFALSAALKKCGGGQSSKELHYEVVKRSETTDVPMLSSEFYLLYGPVEKLLAAEPSVPPPPNGILRKVLDSGAVVYVDMVNLKILKTVYKGRVIPNPEIAQDDALIKETKENCQTNSWSPHPNDYSMRFLKIRASGTYPTLYFPQPCLPIVKLNWPNQGDLPPSEKVSLRQAVISTRQASEQIQGVSQPRILSDEYYPNCRFAGGSCPSFTNLTEKELRIDLADLKPGAKNLLATVLPELIPHNERDADELLKSRVNELLSLTKTYNPLLARTIEYLLKKIETARRGLSAADLETALFGNFSGLSPDPGFIDYSPELGRLAHLLAVAAVEGKLRRIAIANPQAQKALIQLEQIRSCEDNIL